MHNLTDPPSSSAEAAIDLRLAALERQMAGLSGRLQLAEEQNLALAARITGLAGSVADLHAEAFALRTLEEMAGYGTTASPAARRSRPRHLQALPGGAR